MKPESSCGGKEFETDTSMYPSQLVEKNSKKIKKK